MDKLQFNHVYCKFPFSITNMDSVVLLEVLKSKTEELSDVFIEYDTKIKTSGYYDLPHGDILILILEATHKIWNGRLFGYQSKGIFTTIRSWTPEKEQYYRLLRGKEICLELKGE